ncbi:SIMPL domain-containing protein [Tsuneonella mangrovi]|uniref:SIMPL domain-containing protein n=1 Tax=Tsuneonella mangrovi TaxID=1982042 RepID=UPI000BA268D2|nr:SIMPL domain-containing protein [Tsuneonella mangrovi]
MQRMFIPIALALGTAALSAPAAAEVQVQSQGPVVDLSVTKTIRAKPDMVTVGAGVSTIAPTAVEAMQQNATAMDALVKRIKALGIAPEDVQTTGINLNARYRYDQTSREQVFDGYQASNRVSVTLHNVERAGPMLDALVAAGATDISGPNFAIEDDTALQEQARKAAFAELQSRAKEYAQWSGYSGVRLLQVGESVSSSAPMPMLKRTMDAVAAAPPTPVEPGLVGTSVTVSASFEMTQ